MQHNSWRLELLKWRPLTTRNFVVTFYQGSCTTGNQFKV
jgi:hypothetical protein